VPKSKRMTWNNKGRTFFILDATATTRYCSMIIDGGSCTNVTSTILVEKNEFNYLEVS
jgi:hypothetical protein